MTWFVHAEWVVVLVTLLGGFYALDGKMEQRFTYLDSKIEQQALYTNTRIDQANSRIDQTNSRIDQLNCRMDQFQQMFYDLLKEQKASK